MVDLPCIDCKGTCCTGHRGVLLDDGSVLAFEDGRCPHVTDAGRCRIYDTRPRGCRAFDCSREPGYLRTHPHVAVLLSLHGVTPAALPAAADEPDPREPGDSSRVSGRRA